MKKAVLLFALLGLISLHEARGQDRVISGKVTSDEDGTTIPGVAVSAKGTVKATLTDMDGNFKLTIPSNTKALLFYLVGMKTQEVPLGATDNVDVKMKADVLKLDEVVVTAIGIKKEKKALGYSTQVIGGESMTKAGQSNALTALSGKVSGLQVISSSGSPGGSVALRLRGATSITGINEPLLVIDGVEFDNTMNATGNPDDGANRLLESVGNSNRAIDINPEDIESINVLKGPAAAALYGSRGANGAIIITTKKGSSGDGMIHVAYSTNQSWETVNKLPELQNKFVKGSGGGIASYKSGSSGSWGANGDTLYWDPNQTTPFNQNGELIGATAAASNSNAIKFKPFDNLDQFFRLGHTSEHNIAVSGGNENASVRFSISALDQKGVVPESDYKRYSAKLSAQGNLTNKLSVSGSVTYTNSGGRRVQQGSNLSGLMLDLLRTPISFDNSNGSDDPKNASAFMFDDGTQRNYRGGGGYDNPYWTINQNPFKDRVDRMFGVAQTDFKATSWLTFTSRLGTDFYTDSRKQIIAINSRLFPGGKIYKNNYFYRHLNSDLYATLAGNLTQDIKATLVIGNNLFSKFTTADFVQGSNLNFADFSNISVANDIIARESSTKFRTSGYYGSGTLDYKSYLFLTLTAREDVISSLPKGDRSQFYPSANLSWIFTENILKGNKILPYGKIRAAYVKAAKYPDAYSINNYYDQTFYNDGWTSGSSFPITTVDGGSSSSVVGFTNGDVLGGGSRLGSEITSSYEFGTELKFFQNRAGIDFTYYYGKSKDDILNVPIPGSTGYKEQIRNSANITNKGEEIILYVSPIETKDFKWTITLNWSQNKSMVNDLAEGVNEVHLGGFEGSGIYAVKGQPLGSIYGTRWLRDGNGNVVINDDPTSSDYGYPIQDAQVGVIGNVMPKWIGGINNLISYKGISLSALIDIKKGGDIWNGTRGALNFFGMSKETETRNDNFTFDGVKGHLDADGNLVTSGTTNDVNVVRDQTYYQGIGSGFGGPTEQFVEDGTYVKLREVALSYELSKNLLKKTPFKAASLSLIGRNLWIHTKYKGVDPETSLSGASNSQGMDYFNMPGTRSIGFSLRVSL